jgi:hypothetical protein
MKGIISENQFSSVTIIKIVLKCEGNPDIIANIGTPPQKLIYDTGAV